jgi:2-keto-4-pentenoate hydratase/2-oxohepta-3-ene-1,7-dioic acid hydratase in catechol pathway
MAAYKLATVQTSIGARAAAVIGDVVYDAAALTGDERYTSVQNILEDWHEAHRTLEAAADNPDCAGIALTSANLLAPIPKPSVIYCVGANYRDHAEEMAKMTGRPTDDPRAGGGKPWFFLKSPHTVVSTDTIIHVSQYGIQIDWEAELVVIIGRKARNVTVDMALDCVAGYTCGNDLSARDQGFRLALAEGSPFRADWTRHKSFDDACPMGPWIVPASHVSNPADLSIRLWVNEELKQNSNSGNMIFSVAEQISSLSADITLHPGDVIMTGTPAGVGMSKREFLKPDDVVRVEISEIGTIRNVVA